MKVRWIGDARTVMGLGPCHAGMELDLDGDMLASLLEQGKVEKIGMVEHSPVVRVIGSKTNKE